MDAAPLPQRSRAPASLLLLFLLLLVTVLFAHIWIGGYGYRSLLEIWSELVRGPAGDTPFSRIVWQIRLPRAIGCALVGAILGYVGSAFQAMFRNPLAEPYIVGVSSGAAAGGTAALVLGFSGALGGLAMMGAAFMGGLLALVLVLSIAGRRGVIDVKTLLLAGVVTSSLLSAVLAFMLLLGGRDTNVILRWLLGSTSEIFWNEVLILLAASVFGLVLLTLQAKRLNAFAIGEATAQRLGVDTERLKWIVLGTGSAVTAIAVGTVGIIGFLGLVAPHISRRLLGVDWRWSLVGSALLGSTILLAADILAQRALPGREIQVGIVTALIGAPFLLVLLRKPV